MYERPPVLVFAFTRPVHLKRTLDALSNAEGASEHDLVIYCDGPRHEKDVPLTEATRAVATAEGRFRSTNVVASNRNKGLATSIIEGVSAQLKEHSSAIVLEDDIEVAPMFLRYMSDALAQYADFENVASVCAYMYPIDSEGLPPTFCLKGTDCWGWGTWRRAWNYFEPNGKVLLDQLSQRNLSHEFDFDGRYPYVKMLKNQIAGRNNSWAIRWHASAYLRDMVSVFPNRSLVRNFGFDGSGTHCDANSSYDVDFTEINDMRPWAFTDNLQVNEAARERIGRFFAKTTQSGIKRRMNNLARRVTKLISP